MCSPHRVTEGLLSQSLAATSDTRMAAGNPSQLPAFCRGGEATSREKLSQGLGAPLLSAPLCPARPQPQEPRGAPAPAEPPALGP